MIPKIPDPREQWEDGSGAIADSEWAKNQRFEERVGAARIQDIQPDDPGDDMAFRPNEFVPPTTVDGYYGEISYKPDTPATNYSPPNEAAKSYLEQNPDTVDDFDRKYGPGAAVKILGEPAKQEPEPYIAPEITTKHILQSMEPDVDLPPEIDRYFDRLDAQRAKTKSDAIRKSSEQAQKQPASAHKATIDQEVVNSYKDLIALRKKADKSEEGQAALEAAKQRHRAAQDAQAAQPQWITGEIAKAKAKEEIIEKAREGKRYSTLSSEIELSKANARRLEAERIKDELTNGIRRRFSAQEQLQFAERMVEARAAIERTEGLLKQAQALRIPEEIQRYGAALAEAKEHLRKMREHERWGMQVIPDGDQSYLQSLGPGILRGGATVAETLGGAAVQYGENLGLPGLKRAGELSREGAEILRGEVALPLHGELSKLDLSDPNQVVHYVADKFGEAIGTGGAIMAGYLTGGIVAGGSIGLSMGIGEVRNAIEEAAKETGAKLTKTQMAAAVYFYGSIVGGLDTWAMALHLTPTASAKKELKRRMVRAFVKHVAGSAVRESITETVQEMTVMLAQSHAAKKGLTWQEFKTRVIEAAGAGFVAGKGFGLVGAPGAAMAERQRAEREKLFRDLEKQAAEESKKQNQEAAQKGAEKKEAEKRAKAAEAEKPAPALPKRDLEPVHPIAKPIKVPKVKPEDIMKFIRDRGGIQDIEGELRAIEVPKSILAKEGEGLRPDEMRELLVEAGFIQEVPFEEQATTTTDDMYDLIRRAMSGERVVRLGEEGLAEEFDADRSARIYEEQEVKNIIDDLKRQIEEQGAVYDLDEGEEARVVEIVKEKGGDPVDAFEELAIRRGGRRKLEGLGKSKTGPDTAVPFPSIVKKKGKVTRQNLESLVNYLDKGGSLAPRDFPDLAKAVGVMEDQLPEVFDAAVDDDILRVDRRGRPMRGKALEETAKKLRGPMAALSTEENQNEHNYAYALETVLKRGKTARIDQSVIDETFRVADTSYLPDGTELYAFKRARPLTTAEWLERDDNAEVEAVYQKKDGSEVSVFLPRNYVTNLRGFYSHLLSGVFLRKLRVSDRFEGAVNGEIRHEGLHARWQLLDAGLRARLVALAHGHGILDLTIDEVTRHINAAYGDEGTNSQTLRKVYTDLYVAQGHAKEKIAEKLDEEAVAHMIELHHHGYFFPEEMAAVADILPVLEGKPAGEMSEGVMAAIRAYHGSEVNYVRFDPSRSLTGGISLGLSKSLARQFGDNVKTVDVAAGKYFDFRNPKDVERASKDLEEHYSKDEIASGEHVFAEEWQFQEWLRKNNYDGYYFRETSEPDGLALGVLTPGKVRDVDTGKVLFALGGLPSPMIEKWVDFTESVDNATLEITDREGRPYEVRRESGMGSITFNVSDGDAPVGSFYVRAMGTDVSVATANVSDEYQGRGIATAIYDMVEKLISKAGYRLMPSPPINMLKGGQAFWEKRDAAKLKEVREREAPADMMFALAGRKLPGEQRHVPTRGLEEPTRSLPELSKDLVEALGQPSELGRLNQGLKAKAGKQGGKLQGQYDPKTGVVRTAMAHDIATLSHEGGHALKDRYGARFTQKLEAHRPQLEKIAIANNPDLENEIQPPRFATKQQIRAAQKREANRKAMLLEEGFAEWFRIYITHNRLAEKLAPSLMTDFDAYVDAQDPGMRMLLEDVIEGLQEWYDSPSAGRLASRIKSTERQSLITKLFGKGVYRTVSEGADAVRSEVRQKGAKAATQEAMEDFFSGGKVYFDKSYAMSVDNLHSHHVISQRMLNAMNLIHPQPDGQRIGYKNFEDDPYKNSRMARYGYQGGFVALMNGVIPYHGTMWEGASLNEAITTAVGGDSVLAWHSPARKWFSTYLAARRFRDEWRRYDNGELDQPPDLISSRETNKMEIAEIEAKYPQFIEAAEQYYEFTGNLLKLAFDAGFLTQEEYDLYSSRNDYAPLNRIMDEKGGEVLFKPRTLKAKLFNLFRGSTRDIIDPLESTMKFTFELYYMIGENDAKKAFDRMAQQLGKHGGQFFERIPTHEIKQVGTFNPVDEAVKVAQKVGADPLDIKMMTVSLIDVLGEDSVGTLYRPTLANERGEPILWMWENGKRVALRVNDPELARDVVNGFDYLGDRHNQEIFLSILSKPAQILRWGVTFEPGFILRNFAVNQAQMYANVNIGKGMLDEYSYKPVLSGAWGTYHATKALFGKQDDMFDMASASGMIMGGATLAQLPAARTKRSLMGLRKKGIRFHKAALPWTLDYGYVAGLTEAGDRYAIWHNSYKRALRDGVPDYSAYRNAGFVATDVLDFGMHGSHTYFMRRTMPFANAGTQGLASSIRSWAATRNTKGTRSNREHVADIVTPYAKATGNVTLTAQEQQDLSHSAKFVVSVAMLSLISFGIYLAFRDDEDVQEVDDWVHHNHDVFKLHGTVFRWPRGFELGAPAHGLIEIHKGIFKNDEKAMERFLKGLFSNLVPPHSMTGLTVSKELWANKSTLTGGPIVPKRLEKYYMSPELQYTKSTSEFSKWLAQRLGIASRKLDALVYEGAGDPLRWPAVKIEHAMRGYGAGMAKNLLFASDYLIFGKEEFPDSIARYPVASRFAVDPNVWSRSKSKFWSLMRGQSGRWTLAASGYKASINEDKHENAKLILDRISPQARTFVLLDAYGSAPEKRRHPLKRAELIARSFMKMRRELDNGKLKKSNGEPFSPSERSQFSNHMNKMEVRVFRNALILADIPGARHRKILPEDAVFREFKALNKELYQAYLDEAEKKKIPTFDEMREDWKFIKREVSDPNYGGEKRFPHMSDRPSPQAEARP